MNTDIDDPVLTITFIVGRDGDIFNDTQTHGNTFAQVYRAMHVVKDEIARQIAQRRECPYNPINPQPPAFERGEEKCERNATLSIDST